MRCHTLDMRTSAALRPIVATALILALLSGCSLLGDVPKWGAKRDAAKAANAVPTLPEPVPTHRFVIEPTTDIVGVVQKTTATKEDTLTDIARRFNVGYEEIVRANPGVDPWLPGENREIVIPSQFILPNAPREGIVINAAAMRLFYYPKVKKGEPQVVHTYPIGIGKVGWKTPEGATKIVRRQKDPTWRPTASIIKEHREERGEKLDPVIGPGPGQSARSLRVLPRLADVHDPRHQQACRRGIALEPWLHSPVPGRHRAAVRDGARRHAGARRESALPVRLARRRAAHPGLRRARRRSARLEKGAGQVAQQGDGRAHPEGARGAQGKDRLGRRLAALARAARHSGVGVRADPISSTTSSPRATIVQNKVAPGATWDGLSDLPVDEETFQELVSDRESSVESAAAAAAPAPTTKPVTIERLSPHRNGKPPSLVGTA